MFIGKWNKSVILTYVGLVFSICGMCLAMSGYINYSFICLICAGVCDMFDGTIARRCKRTEDEKKFGIELDSLVDVVSFGVFPIVIMLSLGYTSFWQLIIYSFYAICQIARLAHFNITLEEENKDKPVKYYQGLPVTFTALILPCAYLFSFILKTMAFEIFMSITILVTAFFNILNIRVIKPRGKAYAIFAILAIVFSIFYVVM